MTSTTALFVILALTLVAILCFFLGRLTAGQSAAGLKAALEYERQTNAKRSAEAEAQFTQIAESVLSRSQGSLLALAAERFESQRTEATGDLVARQHAIEVLVGPMRESLAALTQQIGEIEKARGQAYGELNEQVRGMGEQANSLRTETSRLREALRTTGTRGRWGEMQLRRIVEYSGMMEHCDFDEQATVNGSGDNKQRPDLVVRLTEKRSIAVDSKVPLDAYLSAMDAADEASQKRLLDNHAKAVKGHVNALSGKAYWKAIEPSPDITVLFVPGEPFLRAAMESDPTLLEYAMEKQIVLTTPTMLVALLRTIAYGWRQDQFSAQARDVYEQARELLTRLGTMHSHFVAMGKALDGTTEAYNKAVGSMESRVLPQARRIAEMGVGSETLPELPAVKIEARDLNNRSWGPVGVGQIEAGSGAQ